MDINNVSTFITLDPSKLFNAEGLYNRAMVMYEGDEDLVESFLKEHLASDSLAYAMHLLEETSSTSYMGVKIHYNGTSFSAPTAGVYGVKSRPEIKARIKAKVLKRFVEPIITKSKSHFSKIFLASFSLLSSRIINILSWLSDNIIS